jgi:putative transposase
VRLHPAGRWHISIRFDDPTIKPLPLTDKAIGIDLGISRLLSTSDGEKISNPKPLKKHYRKLRQAQKSLSRKQKGSKNREKARRQVARIHAQITDTRKDHIHKLTTQLVRENQTIVVEDLAVKNIIKNPKLAQAISDASWGEITRQLAYKCRWYGRTYIEIDRWFPSSKRCSHCGYLVEKMPLSVREWECSKCGTHHDRDINASKNILAAGLAVTVCGASVRRSLRSSRSLHPRERRPEQSKSVKATAKKQKPRL